MLPLMRLVPSRIASRPEIVEDKFVVDALQIVRDCVPLDTAL